jgi:hypothetical protein
MLLIIAGSKHSAVMLVGVTAPKCLDSFCLKGTPALPPGEGRKALRTYASSRKFFEVRTSDTLAIETHK